MQARYAGGPVSARLLREAEQAAARLASSARATRPAPTCSPGGWPWTWAAAGSRPPPARGGREPQARPGADPGQRLAQRGAAGRGGRGLAADARRVPPRARGAGRVPVALGASELRAQATAHGSELAALAQRHAALARRPRLLLAWSERWRATALAVPAVRPPADAELNAGLTALRDVSRRLDKARQGAATPAGQREQQRLEREQLRLERVVRSCALRTRGTAHGSPAAVSVAGLLDGLGPAQLVEIVDIDGTLQVLVCGAGRVRQFTAGRAEAATTAASFARFALRRLARGPPGDDLGSAAAILTAAGPRLEAALLGPAARHLSDGPVVIVPPGRCTRSRGR